MTTMTQRHIVVVGGDLDYLVRFRGHLMAELRFREIRVTACAPDEVGKHEKFFRDLGVEYLRAPMTPTGINPVREARSIVAFTKILRRLSPTDVFAYGAKPITVALTAACVAGVRRRYAMLAGLGYAFVEDNELTFKRWLVRKAQMAAFRVLLPRCQSVIFHNIEDETRFVELGLLSPERAFVVPGSGVDIDAYSFSTAPVNPVKFVFVGRLLRSKGVVHLVEAAAILRASVPSAEVHIVGGLVDNPDVVDSEYLDAAARQGTVILHGHVDDVRPYLASSSAFVLPTYYREGLPRSALEALSMGRTVIVSDAPGCREVVEEGVYGTLVPLRDSAALARTLIEYARDPNRLIAEGIAAREAAVRRFSDTEVNVQMMRALGVEP